MQTVSNRHLRGWKWDEIKKLPASDPEICPTDIKLMKWYNLRGIYSLDLMDGRIPKSTFLEERGHAAGGLIGNENMGYRVSANFAEALVQSLEDLPGAHDLARKICGTNLDLELDLPPALLRVAGGILLEQQAAPKRRGRYPEKLWARDLLIVQSVELAKSIGFKPTRNEATSEGEPSGCELVHEMLNEYGIHELSLEGIRSIWKKRRKLLEESNIIIELFEERKRAEAASES